MFLVSQPVKEKIRGYRSCLVHLAQRIVPTTVMVKQGILDAQFSTNLCCAQVRFGPLPTLWLQAYSPAPQGMVRSWIIGSSP